MVVSALLYGTYLGGSGSDYIFGMTEDPTGDVIVVGYTDSQDFPTTQGAFGSSSPWTPRRDLTPP